MPEIITIGETMAAFTPKATGFLHYIKDYEMKIAGAESNLAIGVAKLGHSAGWVSRLGSDEFGEFVRNLIRAEGVDTGQVVFDPAHRTGLMFKQIQSGHETSVFYYRENSAASHMDSGIITNAALKGCKILHMTGITPVLSPSCMEMTKAALAMAAREGIDISFDPNIRRKLWGEQDYAPVILEMMLQAQIVLLGTDEAEVLLGSSNPEQVRDKIFSGQNARMIALKDGAKGAVILTEGEKIEIPPFPCHCVDPIGAGDAFNAAFLCGVLEGKSAGDCGKMGGVAGALATETYGDTEGYPSAQRLRQTMEKQSVIYR